MSTFRGGSRLGWRGLALSGASLMASAGLSAGCNEDEALRAFRDAASGSLQDGLTSIAGGVIDGAFAVFELGSDESGSGDGAQGGGAGGGG